MTFTITLLHIKLLGIPLIILAFLAFIYGDLPDHRGSGFWNVMRVIIWPALVLWIGFFLIKGFFF